MIFSTPDKKEKLNYYDLLLEKYNKISSDSTLDS